MFVVICTSCLAGGLCAALLQKLEQEQSLYSYLGREEVCAFIPQSVLYGELTKHRGQHWVFKAQELKTTLLPSGSTGTGVIYQISQKKKKKHTIVCSGTVIK